MLKSCRKIREFPTGLHKIFPAQQIPIPNMHKIGLIYSQSIKFSEKLQQTCNIFDKFA